MRYALALAGLVVIAASAVATIQSTPLRYKVVDRVTVYDTIVVPLQRNGTPVELCEPKIRRAIAALEDESLWHDIPRIVAAACGAMGLGGWRPEP